MIEKPLDTVLMNCPSSQAWTEDSFLGDLENIGVWSPNKYWELECALYLLTANQLDRAILAAVFKIYSRLIRLFSSHRDPNDAFRFVKLTSEDVFELEERIELVFEGVFFAKMPSQSLFSQKNPLME